MSHFRVRRARVGFPPASINQKVKKGVDSAACDLQCQLVSVFWACPRAKNQRAVPHALAAGSSLMQFCSLALARFHLKPTSNKHNLAPIASSSKVPSKVLSKALVKEVFSSLKVQATLVVFNSVRKLSYALVLPPKGMRGRGSLRALAGLDEGRG